MNEPQQAATSVDEINERMREYFGSTRSGVLKVDHGDVLAYLDIADNDLRPGEIIMGPSIFMLADSALFYATFSVAGYDIRVLTSDVQIRFIRPAVGHRLLARAKVLNHGSKSVTAQVVLFTTDESKPVAVAQGTCMLPK